MPSLLRGLPAPLLDLPLADGGRWVLGEQQPDRFALPVFYRGSHCPQCRKQLHELSSKFGEFARLGATSVVAISGDDEQRATSPVQEWELADLPVAYGLTSRRCASGTCT